MGLDQRVVPDSVTLYYDPILKVHQRLPVTIAMTYCFYLAPQVPEEARRLFDAAAANAGISKDGIRDLTGHRINAIAWFLSREWDQSDLAAVLREALRRLPVPRDCQCESALECALVTPEELVPADVKRDLAPIIGRYMKQE